MTIQTTVGCTRSIAATYGADVAISAITNASPAVVTLAAGHSVAVGDYVEIKSGWRNLTDKVLRVSVVMTNDVTLEGFDTSDVVDYPTDQGIGSLRRITAWHDFDQAKDVKTSGGEQQWLTQTVDGETRERKMPSIRSAITVDVEVYDDPSMPWYQTALAASRTRRPAAYRIRLAIGAISVVNAYWGVGETPSTDKNAEVVTKVSLAYLTPPQRYAA
ncbi:MAG: phage tail tube protein [Sulfuricellaceae bacterium]